jgi:hypothetical protein
MNMDFPVLSRDLLGNHLLIPTTDVERKKNHSQWDVLTSFDKKRFNE